MRCERVIHLTEHSDQEIERRWLHNINRRLTDDKIIATRIRRDEPTKNLVKHTWEPMIRTEEEAPPGFSG